MIRYCICIISRKNVDQIQLAQNTHIARLSGPSYSRQLLEQPILISSYIEPS